MAATSTASVGLINFYHEYTGILLHKSQGIQKIAKSTSKYHQQAIFILYFEISLCGKPFNVAYLIELSELDQSFKNPSIEIYVESQINNSPIWKNYKGKRAEYLLHGITFTFCSSTVVITFWFTIQQHFDLFLFYYFDIPNFLFPLLACQNNVFYATILTKKT